MIYKNAEDHFKENRKNYTSLTFSEYLSLFWIAKM